MKSELLRRGRGLATITQSEPLLLRCSVFVWEVQHSPGARHGSLARSQSCSSFELGNDDLSWPLASDPLDFGIASCRGSALGSRSCWLQPCSATMT